MISHVYRKNKEIYSSEISGFFMKNRVDVKILLHVLLFNLLYRFVGAVGIPENVSPFYRSFKWQGSIVIILSVIW